MCERERERERERDRERQTEKERERKTEMGPKRAMNVLTNIVTWRQGRTQIFVVREGHAET